MDRVMLLWKRCVHRRLSSKLLKQGYLVECLQSSFRKFSGRYWDLIQQNEVSLSRMLNDILTLGQQWLPNQLDFSPISWPLYQLWPSPHYEWFPWSICNGCGVPAGNAYPSGHLVPSPHFGTCLCSNCWDQIPRTFYVFTRLFISNTPWYFLDFTYHQKRYYFCSVSCFDILSLWRCNITIFVSNVSQIDRVMLHLKQCTHSISMYP